MAKVFYAVGTFISTPIASTTSIYNALMADPTDSAQSVSDSCVGVTICQNEGHRDIQEDYYQAIIDFNPDPQGPTFLNRLSATGTQSITAVSRQSFFGVYDGHGGDEVSKHLHQHLHKTLLDNLPPLKENAPPPPPTSAMKIPPLSLMTPFKASSSTIDDGSAPLPPPSPARSAPGTPGKSPGRALTPKRGSFDEGMEMNTLDRQESESGLLGGEDCEGQSAIGEIVRGVYTEIDNQIAGIKVDGEEGVFGADSGSTAATCLMRSEEGKCVLYCANVGDSRVVLCRNGAPVRLTKDHRCNDALEVKRIKDAGGFVFNRRVGGCLSVTRSFGHVNDKFLILGDPYTSRTVVDPLLDECVILASDGVWDSMKEDVVCRWVTQGLVEGKKLKEICDDIVRECLRKYARDNICIVIVAL